jgi:hypothetical protein
MINESLLRKAWMRSCAFIIVVTMILPSVLLSSSVSFLGVRSFVNAAAAAEEHPRLFFSSEEIPTLRTQAQGTHQEIWEPILTFANEKIDSSPVSTPQCPDLEIFRHAGNQLIAFAFAFVITDDPAYFDLTRRHLLGYASWEYWGDESECGHRDLGHHHMLLGNTIAYDWLYNQLSIQDRETISANLARRAQESYETSISEASQWGGWWRKAYLQNHHWINHSALGMAALVLEGEDPRAQDWLNQAVDQLSRVSYILEGMGDGSWHEGISYQSYGLTLSVPFRYNLRRLKGQDIFPHKYLQDYASWRAYNILPDTVQQVMTFGDFEMDWGNSYASQNILRFIAAEYSDGSAEWAAQHLIQTGGRHSNVWNAPWYVFEFFYYDPTVQPIVPETLPLSHTFSDLEGVIWRTGWSQNDLVFGYKTGAYGGRFAFDAFINGQYPFDHPGVDKLSNGHDHQDTNSFYLYRGNVDLSSEVVGYGSYDASYHNTLLIDGMGQYQDPDTFGEYSYWDRDPDVFRGADGKLEAIYETINFNFLVSDATNRYRLLDSESGVPGERLVSEFRRYVLFVRPDYLVMVDNIHSDDNHNYEWVSHLGTSVSIEGDWIKGDAGSDQVLGIKVLAPQTVTTAIGDDGKPFVHIRPATEVASTRFVTVLYPTRQVDWGGKPSITLLGEDDRAAGLRVEQGGDLEDHLIKVGSELDVRIGEYAFDTQVASVTQDVDGNLVKIFFAKGSYLADRDGNRTLLHSSREDVVMEVAFEGEGLSIFGESLEGLSIYAPDVDVNQVTVNDQQVPAIRDGDYVVINYNPFSTFADVPLDHWAHDTIEVLYQEGYVSGCSEDPLLYCPEDILTRAESAVFIERGIHGASYMPQQPTEQIFADVPLVEWYAKWATALWEDGYTAGCDTDPLSYCPLRDHTRAEGCVFFLRMMHGAEYLPPEPVGLFADVPLDAWYADWVEAAYNAGIIPACQTEPELRFCPQNLLDRAMAAYMMVQAKGLPLP